MIAGVEYSSFAIADYSSGHRRLITLVNEQQARCRAKEIAIKLASGDDDARSLTSQDRLTYLRALDLFQPTGVTLNKTLDWSRVFIWKFRPGEIVTQTPGSKSDPGGTL